MGAGPVGNKAMQSWPPQSRVSRQQTTAVSILTRSKLDERLAFGYVGEMMSHLRPLLPAWILGALALSGALAAPPLVAASTAATVSFAHDVKPILAKRCFACHGPDTAEGGLALHEAETAFAALDSGRHAIVAGAADESELLRRVAAEDPAERMPPEGKPLDPEEVAILRTWIEQGAAWQKHWSFEPVARQTPPAVRDSAWVRNEIDAFILARLEARGLAPAPPAERAVLARRVYFDLTGLPPTPEQLAEFLADQRPDAYERLVDKLLASPHYGEHWARHWLDVVRYAESNSFERDNPKPNVWKYRDYVIRSLNDDKPYDQFVREQLAGDELDEVTAKTMTATGYYRLGVWDDEPADPVQARADEMDDIVSTTGQAFLGLTVGCARCHDHKIDPFPQKDYFGLAAFMADVTSYGTRGDQTSYNQWDATSPKDRERRASLRRQIRRQEQEKHRLEQRAIVRMPGELQRLTEEHERQRVLDEHLSRHFEGDEQQQYDVLLERIATLKDEVEALPPAETVLALAKANPNPPATHIHLRGNPHVLGDEVQPRFPEIFGDEKVELPPPKEGARSAGRRRVLADWIASPENMLTSRVIANRVWQHTFGRGIVRSPNNFGQLGIPPTHPELLDFLATYLVDHQWRLKPLVRFVVTSSAYRMSSSANPEALAVDPTNDLFWRFDLRRLTAEEVRDSVLVVAGQLNDELYGPSIYPKLSREVLATQSMPGHNWNNTMRERERSRRSVYIHIKRSLLVPLLTAFDLPDPDSSCEARFNTTQPAQAFALLHSEFLHQQAGHLARRVEQQVGGDIEQQIAQSLRLVFGREPTVEEVSEGLLLMGKLQNDHGKEPGEALRYYCLAMLNFSEFLYLD